MKSGDVNETIKMCVEDTKKDSKLLGYLNYVNWRLTNAKKVLWGAKKNGNNELAESTQTKIDDLNALSGELSSKMSSDPSLVRFVNKQAARRIAAEIRRNPTNHRYQNAGIRPFANWKEANDYLNNNWGQVKKIARQKPINIKGINTQEYLDVVIFNELLGGFRDYYVDPSYTANPAHAKEFEKDIMDVKQGYSRAWRDFFGDKKRRTGKNRPWMDENMITELTMQKVDRLYQKWMGRGDGLEKLFLWKIMAPEADPGTVTYFNGVFSEGIRV